MEAVRLIKIAKELIASYYQKWFGITLEEDEFLVMGISRVWEVDRLLMATTVDDKRFFEINYRGEDSEVCLNVYQREHADSISIKL